MMSMSQQIESFLAKFEGKIIYFFPNPGNAGDSVINYSTYQLFHKFGINFKIVSAEDDLQGKIAFYGGGGNFVEYYNNASSFIAKWHRKVEHLIILPSTINDHRELLSELGENVDIICREKASFNYVKGLNNKSRIHLMEDMAFTLDMMNYQKNPGLSKGNFRNQINNSLLRVLAQYFVKNSKILNSFRNDMESTNISIPIDNIDIAKVLECSDMGEEATREVTYDLLFFLNQFNIINTNRLHICICGLLLGKQVNFFPNSYYKNEEVYHHSMKGRYFTLTWRGE